MHFYSKFDRRLRETIKNAAVAKEHVDTEVVLAGLSNVYTHYITTKEEYQVQRYEGSSTLFGPNTLQAYQQQYTFLIENILEVQCSKHILLKKFK